MEGDDGVEISRLDGEPASSQVEGLAEAKRLSFDAMQAALTGSNADEPAGHDDEVPVPELAQTQWPGTQALLSKAHADFFRSPEKAASSSLQEAAETPGSGHPASDPVPASTHREPLRTLSQEPVPLPSTQAMVNAWSPWSTVKKPKGNSARVAMGRKPAVATVAEERRRSSLRFSGSTTDSPTMRPVEDADRRRSSLRFSTSTAESPVTGVLPFTVTKTASQSQSQSLEKTSFADRTVTPTSIMRTTGRSQHSASRRSSTTQQAGFANNETTVADDPTTIVPASAPATLDPSAEINTGPPMSSCQYGQGNLLFRDDSDVGRTINEVEASCLDLTEMDGVMSQRRM